MPIIIPQELDISDRKIMEQFFSHLGTRSPSLNQIWSCMDSTWDEIGCDNKVIDKEKYMEFYNHPIWLLNGLFIEQHKDSLSNRDIFSNWVIEQKPKRIADYGGGFGTLARMIATKNRNIEIDVIEPHPHYLALKLARYFPQITYKNALEGEYDLLLATDVFEHVEDPLDLVEISSNNLVLNGKYLMANCFQPVIKCHLPCTFHFRYSWDLILSRINLAEVGKVLYGTIYQKVGSVSASKARPYELLSQKMFPVFKLYSEVSRKVKARIT